MVLQQVDRKDVYKRQVLSNHTQYPDFSFLDLTDEMPKIIAQWKKLNVQFDAIYTGTQGSFRFRMSEELIKPTASGAICMVRHEVVK